MRFLFACIFMLLVNAALAQSNTRNSDLRTNKEIFSIKEYKKKETIFMGLQTSVSNQYTFNLHKNDKLSASLKLDGNQAQKLDDEFVDQFISVRYIIKSKKKSKCKLGYELNLRGEKHKICLHEKEKIETLKKFVRKLQKNFFSKKDHT